MLRKTKNVDSNITGDPHNCSPNQTLMKSILLSLSFLVIILSTAFMYVKTDDRPEIVEMTLPLLEVSKAHTLEVLDAMPESSFSYKPTDVNKTFAEQMVHIGYSLHYFSEGMIKGNRMKYEEPDASGMTKAEIREIVVKGFDEIISSVSELSEDDLKVMLPFGPDTKISRAQAVIFAHDHVTNHRAKANLYLRMNNIDPPNYKFL